jgi:hypothetical protein
VALGSYDVIRRGGANAPHLAIVSHLESDLARSAHLLRPEASVEDRLAVMRTILFHVHADQNNHAFATSFRTVPADVHRSVVDAWHRLPEALRDKIVEEVTFQGGPADMTKDLPSQYWSTDDQQSDPAYAAALAELRAHPDVLLRYLLMND